MAQGLRLTLDEYKRAQRLSRFVALLTIAGSSSIILLLPASEINMVGLIGVVAVLTVFTVVFYTIPALAYNDRYQLVPDMTYLVGIAVGTYFLGRYAPYFSYTYLVVIGTHTFTHGFSDFWRLVVMALGASLISLSLNPAIVGPLRLPIILLHVLAILLVCYSFWLFASEMLKVKGELARTEQEAQRLAELERLKTTFLTLASHEMRTPLGNIRGFVELLRGRADEAILNRIEGNLDRLLRLIAEMLHLSRLEEALPTMGTVSLKETVSETVSQFARQAKQKKLKLQTDLHEATVHGSAEELKEMLANLLDNAIRYTPVGGSVTVSVLPRAETVTVAVQDSGIGIPTKEQSSLFQQFFRASNAQKVEPSGTGLGLFIVKRIAERHRGTVQIVSKEGVGTTVSVTLPAAGHGKTHAQRVK